MAKISKKRLTAMGDSKPKNPDFKSNSYGNKHSVVIRAELNTHPAPSAFERVKKSFRASAKALGSIFDRAQIKVEKLYHLQGRTNKLSPCVVYDHPLPSGIDVIVHKTRSLSALAHNFQVFNRRHQVTTAIPPNRIWEDYGQSLVETSNKLLSEDRRIEIGTWAEKNVEDDEWGAFVALTTAELKRLEGATVDKIKVVKATYQVPPSTPTTRESQEPVLEEDLPEDIVHHKDLTQLLGVHSGFHIVPGSGSATAFDQQDNLSDYYGMPLIEDSTNMTYAAEAPEEDDDDEAEEISFLSRTSTYDSEENNLTKARSQVPAQALILHLRGRGLPLPEMAKILAPLDEKFLYGSESRYWKGFRIPEHTEFDDELVEKVLAVAKAGKLWWEEECDQNGRKLPESFRVLKRRLREGEVKRLVRKTVENYVWWRFRMEVVHKDLLRG